MECPKCHSKISETDTVCPKCHKVLLLECPNCHSLEDTAVCTQCGYKILIKCSKCGRINPAINDVCVKCGFSTKTSLAYQECETDELASVAIKFANLKRIKRLLKTKALYEKFSIKLKNLLLSQIKNTEGLFITYDDTYVVNFNKELSLATSSNKAVRFALKLANAFTQINLNVIEELSIPLGLTLTIVKKTSEQLQEFMVHDNKVKMLTSDKSIKKYLRGTQIILDQSVWDEVNRDYKTDSLYTIEENGKTTAFYEIVLESYILAPDTEKNKEPVNAVKYVLNKGKVNDEEETDVYSFKVFDINAKCRFDKTNAVSIKEKLKTIDLTRGGKLLALRSKPELKADINDIIEYCNAVKYKYLVVNCTEEMAYKPWGFFEKLFREYYDIPFYNFDKTDKIPIEHLNAFSQLFDLCKGHVLKASSPEDARFHYIELWSKFLSMLSNTIIIIDGFELLDDTSIQALELYFDRYTNIKPNFIFITSDEVSVHSKIKSLMRTTLYTELKLVKSSFSNCLASIKLDASDFIGSFYFEKIQENFNGSYLYFKYAIKYLMETGVLINFENKLILRGSKSIVVPGTLEDLCKARMIALSDDSKVSDIFQYMYLLDSQVDKAFVEKLAGENINEPIKKLINSGFFMMRGNTLISANYAFQLKGLLSLTEKDDTKAKKILSVLVRNASNDTLKILMLERTKSYKEKYLYLCDNSDFAILAGDYDAYLKNCLGFLSLLEIVGADISEQDIEAKKIDVYNSILMYLYRYAPTKIYFIENVLLMDAINENDNEKIVRLSNLMLQGALLSSNYTDALGLLHNILTRMENPTLLVDGVVNTRFLLLSLVNMEILYNIGKFRECVETAEEILSILRVDIIDKIKPAGFSTNLFISHIMETMRLASFAKLYMMEDDLEDFFGRIKQSLDSELPEKDCIFAIKDLLAGRVYQIGNIEEYSPFSKVVYLILQEISGLKDDYKKFAQNIYQAKLLSDEIHQQEIKYLCDLLIAYAYSKIGIEMKAESIFNDVNSTAEKSAIFNISVLSKYFIALSKSTTDTEQAIAFLNEALDYVQKNDNQAVILYVLLEKLFIETAKNTDSLGINIDVEEHKLDSYRETLKLITGEGTTNDDSAEESAENSATDGSDVIDG